MISTESPTVSVLIVNWNTRDKLRACLASIFRFPPKCSYEVIVVDNASSDKSEEMVRAEFPQVVFIQSGANTGYAVGNNIAFSRARGQLLLTLNPDTEFEDDSLQKSIEEFQSHPELGSLSIKLILPDGSVQRSVRGFPTILNIFAAVFKLDRLFPRSIFGSYMLPRFDYEKTGPAPQPMATFLLFSREALAKVGDPTAPFDPQFPIFFNEVDLLYRLEQIGRPSWHFAVAHVLHHHGSSTKLVKKPMIWESHRSLVRYLIKHTVGPSRLALPIAAVLSYTAAFIRARGYHGGFRPEHHNMQLEHDR